MFRQVVISSTKSKLTSNFNAIGSGSGSGSGSSDQRQHPEVGSTDRFRSNSTSVGAKKLNHKKRRPWTAIGYKDKDRYVFSDHRDRDKENHHRHLTQMDKFNDRPVDSQPEVDANQSSIDSSTDRLVFNRFRKLNVEQRLRNLRNAFAERAQKAQHDLTTRLTAPPPDSDDEDDLAKPIKSLPVSFDHSTDDHRPDVPISDLIDHWTKQAFSDQIEPLPFESNIGLQVDPQLKLFKSADKPEVIEEESELDLDGDEEDANQDYFDLADVAWSKCEPETWAKTVSGSTCLANLKQAIHANQFPTINPQSITYICWLLVISSAFVYNAVFIPYRLAFYGVVVNQSAFTVHTSNSQTMSTDRWTLAIDYATIDLLADLLYTMHLAVWQPHIKYVHNGMWMQDAHLTRRRYFASRQLWLDMLAWLPIDWLVCGVTTGHFRCTPNLILILRLNRFLQAQIFWKLFDRLDSRTRWPYLVRIARTLCHMAYLVHINACAYYGLSAVLGIGSDRWVYNGQGRAYLRCFYFALRTATSISGKMPKPERDSQRIYMTCAWLMGVFVFAFLIGQIRDIIGQANRQHTMYRAVADRIALVLRQLHVPEALRQRASRWLAFTWKEQHTLDEQQIVGLLPSKCRLDIALAQHMHVLRKVRLFRGCDRNAMRELLLRLRPAQYLPGDFVFRFGEPASHMYIVGSGQLNVCAESGHFLATLDPGSVFGELAVLQLPGGTSRRTASVQAVGFCTLFVLSKLDLWDTLGNYPDTEHLLRRRAKAMFKKRKAATQLQLANLKRINKISDVVRAESVIGSAPNGRNRLAETVEHVLKLIKRQQKSNEMLATNLETM